MAKKESANSIKAKARDLLPVEALSFLEKHSKQAFEFDADKHPDMEVLRVKFRSPKSLKLSKFNLCTHEYYLNKGERGDDPNLEYLLPGIDLIADSDGYDPEGILTWFPLLGEFGFWDPDHATIGLFPKIEWPAIERRLPQYLNAQWNETPRHRYLRPWADKRCADLKARKMDS